MPQVRRPVAPRAPAKAAKHGGRTKRGGAGELVKSLVVLAVCLVLVGSPEVRNAVGHGITHLLAPEVGTDKAPPETPPAR